MTVTVTTHDSAETLWVAADRLRILGGVEGSDLSLLEVTVPPGSGTPPHTHLSPELFYVVSGEITYGHFLHGAPPRMTRALPGTTVRVDSMEPHNYTNTGPDTAVMLVLVDPSMVAFFRDLGHVEPPAPGTPPNIAEIMAAMARHGIALAA